MNNLGSLQAFIPGINALNQEFQLPAFTDRDSVGDVSCKKINSKSLDPCKTRKGDSNRRYCFNNKDPHIKEKSLTLAEKDSKFSSKSSKIRSKFKLENNSNSQLLSQRTKKKSAYSKDSLFEASIKHELQ